MRWCSACLANRPLRRLVATLLLGWALCLSLVASHALAEALHHLDGSALCAQGQLIHHWLHALPGDVPTIQASAVAIDALACPVPVAPPPLLPFTGNRDPPCCHSALHRFA